MENDETDDFVRRYIRLKLKIQQAGSSQIMRGTVVILEVMVLILCPYLR